MQLQVPAFKGMFSYFFNLTLFGGTTIWTHFLSCRFEQSG